MNEKQVNEFMQVLADEYAMLHKNHMEVIQDYMQDFITHERYVMKDMEYTARLQTQKAVIEKFLKIKNGGGENEA